MRRVGNAHVLPHDIDTDQIIPGEYLNTVPDDELGQFALRGYDPDLAEQIEPGDILVAGTNLGLGSSREAAPLAIKNAGIGAVVAESFARIFYRNCINVGLPIARVEGITDHVQTGDRIVVDLTEGFVENESTGDRFETTAPPSFLLDILAAGGLIPYRERYGTSQPSSE